MNVSKKILEIVHYKTEQSDLRYIYVVIQIWRRALLL